MEAFRVTEDPSHWEVHPEGGEILYLISGSMHVILQQKGKERIVPLRDRGVCIVPAAYGIGKSSTARVSLRLLRRAKARKHGQSKCL